MDRIDITPKTIAIVREIEHPQGRARRSRLFTNPTPTSRNRVFKLAVENATEIRRASTGGTKYYLTPALVLPFTDPEETESPRSFAVAIDGHRIPVPMDYGDAARWVGLLQTRFPNDSIGIIYII